MLVALLWACLLDHVTSDTDRYTTKYIGCFKVAGTYGDAIHTMYTNSPTDVYSKCESLAHSKGYSVFAISNHEYCYTTNDAYKTFANYGESEGCWKSLVDGRYVEQGGVDSMSVYQIVGHEDGEYRYSSIKCEQESQTMEAVIMIISAEFGSSECGYVNVTTSVAKLCDNVADCLLDYDNFKDLYCNQLTARFAVTYGCVYSGSKSKVNIAEIIGKHIRWIVFVLAMLIVVLTTWCRRRTIRRHPAMHESCWQLHTMCPCLKLYPRDATDQDHGMPRVIANPSQGADYPPASGSYPHSPRTVTNQHVSFNPNPDMPPAYPSSVAPPAYPPPAHTANITYLPPSSDPPGAPPPTYDAATAEYSSSTRRSGGWFSVRR